MTFQSLDLTSLADLLRHSDPNSRDNDDSDDDEEKLPNQKIGPGDIGNSGKSSTGGASKKNVDKSNGDDIAATPKSEIWSSNEVEKDLTKSHTPPVQTDPRKRPRYEMYYSQSVTSEDVFLQMGNKTPGSASCENLVVEVHLPGEEDFNKIQLNLKEQAIDLRSSIHFLYLGLPHPIDTKAGHAKWDQDKEKLIITLKLSRDLDRINL